MNFINYLIEIDIQVLGQIREFSLNHIPYISSIVTIFADLEPILFALFLIGLWIYGIVKKNDRPKQVSLDLFWHVLGAFAIYWILNHVLPARPRPELMLDLPPLINHLPDNSFPSGHAMFWGASWWALHGLLGKPQITLTFFILGFLTCITRVIAGIHYPGDIIVGFFLGWIIVKILMRLPHSETYRKHAHDIPVKIGKFLWM